MSEVSVKLQGGLGNYLFQIASAYSYGLKHGKKPIFTTNDSLVIHKSITNYNENILSNVELIPNKKTSSYKVYTEPAFSYFEIPEIKNSVYLNGYFQSEKYFKEYESEIRELFSYPTSVIDDVTETALDAYGVDLSVDNTCSIHVRRGDYLKLVDYHPSQDMGYYMKAIKNMPKDSVFLVFSDDIEWCKENFPDVPEKFRFVEGSKDYEDLLLQSLCKNNIICNSTFSWWAAWFNENPDKKIISPNKWFGPSMPHDTKDLYCEGWERI